MYRISELAALVGLSRTALLYYEKHNLISSRRLDNGYRVFGDKDLQRVRLVQQLLAGGLTLKECKACLDAKVDRQLLLNRLDVLDQEIEQKQKSRQLLAAMLGQQANKSWHSELDKLAPDAHLEWLITQGFSEKEALRLKWLSKDMNEHDIYMADFMKVFETLERWGPGSVGDTSRAFGLLPIEPKCILEIGCGKGLATQVLADLSSAQITAVDNEKTALDRLEQRFANQGISERLTTVCASMTELPLEKESCDLIWSEGSAYIMGFDKALKTWRPLLAKQGCLVVSDMVWRTAQPSDEAIEFWQHEYPDIQTVPTRLESIKKAGYEVVSHFPQSEQAWMDYYQPLKTRIAELEGDMVGSAAIHDLKREVTLCTEMADQFGYHMFILARR